MTEDGPPDPQLDPTQSPGFDEFEDVSVDRDVTIGEASARELTVGDTRPVAESRLADLVSHLREGDAVERRRAAIELTDRDADPAAIAALEERVREDEDPDVRQFAVEALGEADATESIDPVRDALGDPNPWVRSEAVVALDHLAPEAERERIVAALDDDHHAVRRNAAVSLFKHQGEAALDVLLALADDESERVREWVAHMLGGIGTDAAQDALATLAQDESDVVRKTARAARAADPDDFRRTFCVEGGEPSAAFEDELNVPPDL